MDVIRLLIVDDQTITRSGLHSLLAAQADIEIVGEARKPSSWLPRSNPR